MTPADLGPPDPREAILLTCLVCPQTWRPRLDWRTPETAGPGIEAALTTFESHVLGHLAPAPGIPPDRIGQPRPLTAVGETEWRP